MAYDMAVREGDGEGEELVSRFMLVVFRRTGATNYVNLLLYNQIYLPTSIPAALYHEQKHNRTVGLRSGKGRRKAMDYVNELLNGNLKRTSKQKKSFPNIHMHRRGKALVSP
jgi:hypothetical protein